jgi:anti-sigma-K factor RskA
MRTREPEPHTLAGAYAMDALDDRHRSRFERHLARCQECTREVTGLREGAARLATAAAAYPPAVLKQRLLAETAQTRQLPPVRPASLPPGRARLTGARQPGIRRWAWAATLSLMLAAVMVLTTAVIWLAGQAAQPRPAGQPPAGRSIAAVLTAPDATMISARVKTGGTATVVMSHRDRMLVFSAAGLRALPPSCSYELWLMGPGADRPAGLLPRPRHGMTGPVLASGLRAGDRLGLTVEPAAGSSHPTSAMILLVAL